MSKKAIVFAAVLAALMIILCDMLTGCAQFVGTVNEWGYGIRKTDDATRYSTRKKVEDTCRATIVSYQSDRLTWEQYKDSDSDEQRGWADAAKMRANKAAVTYNEYFLKNSYVFDGNIPDDIAEDLPLIE